MQAGGTALIYQADSRRMEEVAAQSVNLVVTSPPYWQIKDYGTRGQIGHGQDLHRYLADLLLVWEECFRACAAGARLCINVGDQFARASLYGRYRVIPLHAEIICQCAACGFDYLGSIVWRKKTTMNTTGGAVVMGSYPYPPNGIVEIDFEYILLFRRPGAARSVPREARAAAALTRDEWKSWFSGHWNLGGARKKGHEAPFPREIPRRLIRMFSLPGDTVLDPFLGTGTTAAAALELGRVPVGFEISAEYVRMARMLLEKEGRCVEVRKRARGARPPRGETRWVPRVPDMDQPASAPHEGAPLPDLHTVMAVEDDCTLTLETGRRVALGGISVVDMQGAAGYLRERVLKRRVFLKDESPAPGGGVEARVLLKNRISVNAHLVRSGMARKKTTR